MSMLRFEPVLYKTYDDRKTIIGVMLSVTNYNYRSQNEIVERTNMSKHGHRAYIYVKKCSV